tara:strand:+ start:114 stop:653 length:540 start_codon:yes stop_codon:yes gene_type:complete
LQTHRTKKNIKIGVFGGTFDPPHKGHLYIAKKVLKILKLKKIIWVVTKQNPFKKKPFLNTQERINLSKKITKKEKKIFVKYFDKKINSVNTFRLLKYIKKKNPNKKLFFLIGADNLVKFHKWNNWYKIPKLAKIVVYPRKNFSVKSLNFITSSKLSKKDIIYINSKKINISSSFIRKFW